MLIEWAPVQRLSHLQSSSKLCSVACIESGIMAGGKDSRFLTTTEFSVLAFVSGSMCSDVCASISLCRQCHV